MPHPKYELRVASLKRTYAAVPLETLVRLAAEGRLSPQDEVRAVGSETWAPVTDVPALAAGMPTRGEAVAEIEFELDADGGGWTPLKRADDSAEATMDMAPMIDVTFLLLIFFMLTNSLANPSPMVVPEAVHGRGHFGFHLHGFNNHQIVTFIYEVSNTSQQLKNLARPGS